MQESRYPYRNSSGSGYRDKYLCSCRHETILLLSLTILLTGKSQRGLLVGSRLETLGGGLIWAGKGPVY